MLPSFTGEISQVPPRFSALKIDGARAYDLARDEEEFELEARNVSVAKLSLIERPDADHCVLEARMRQGHLCALACPRSRPCARCSSATSQRCGGPGSARSARTRPSPLAELEAAKESAAEGNALTRWLKPIETALRDIPFLALSGSDAARLRQGQSVLLRGRDAPIIEGTVYATSRGKLVALARSGR